MTLSQPTCSMGCGTSAVTANPQDNIEVKESLRRSKLVDYEYQTTLGAGNFGEVHKVKHKGTNLVVALKLVKRKPGQKRASLEKEKLESKILESMSHPFIVHLYKTFRTEEEFYIVMEYLEGGELHQHMKRVGRFTMKQVQFYVSEVALALEYLHKKSIAYRDMKPENMVIHVDGNLMLTDFGLAKHVDKGCKTYSFCGTPEYIAPEIITSEGHNQMVDWWAFGILTFEMLCGFPPFRSDKPEATYKMIREARVDYPKHMDTPSKDLVGKLLVPDLATRLGADGGAEQVKRHKFFRGIDWNALISRQVPAPKLG